MAENSKLTARSLMGKKGVERRSLQGMYTLAPPAFPHLSTQWFLDRLGLQGRPQTRATELSSHKMIFDLSGEILPWCIAATFLRLTTLPQVNRCVI